jgi:hypothetical protein
MNRFTAERRFFLPRAGLTAGYYAYGSLGYPE